ncbi:MAG TPA: hypothetical protein VGS27_03445, partial [Candidatus Sulfotelmatobacter sp.]|nr:hypothetical protein [Candidatus Sulfotelmatobacter sp.]
AVRRRCRIAGPHLYIPSGSEAKVLIGFLVGSKGFLGGACLGGGKKGKTNVVAEAAAVSGTSLEGMAGTTGLEPAASAVTVYPY